MTTTTTKATKVRKVSASTKDVAFDTAAKDVRDAVGSALNARETLASKLLALVQVYSQTERTKLIDYTKASGKRPAELQKFGDRLKGLIVPTWFNDPSLRSKSKRTLEEERAYKRGLAEEKIVTDTLPIVAAILTKAEIAGVSIDPKTRLVTMSSADAATKAARKALGIARGRTKGTISNTPKGATASATMSATKPVETGPEAQARDERAIKSANVSRLVGELSARLSGADWGELTQTARVALLTLAAMISERHNDNAAARQKQEAAKAS